MVRRGFVWALGLAAAQAPSITPLSPWRPTLSPGDGPGALRAMAAERVENKMARVLNSYRRVLAYGFVLTSALTASPALLRAQTAVVAEPVAGLVDAPEAHITQVTRDGARLVATLAPGDDNRVVLDTHTGTTVFADPVRRYTLSPEGSYVAWFDGGFFGDIYLRNLASGEERPAFRSGLGTYAIVLSDEGTRAATLGSFALTLLRSSAVIAGAAGQAMTTIDTRLCPPPGISGTCLGGPLGISADGRHVVYGAYYTYGDGGASRTTVTTADLTTGLTQAVPVQHPDLDGSVSGEFDLSGDGNWIGVTAQTRVGRHPRAALLVRAGGPTMLVAPSLGDTSFMGISDSGRFVLVASPASVSGGERLRVVDRTSGVLTEVIYQSVAHQADYRLESAHLSGDGRTVVGTLVRRTSTDAPHRRTFIARLDSDGDGLHDGWETVFGTNPADPADAALDPDHDGRTNAQENVDGTHPNGVPVRYFAEGANGTFFATSLSLFNPSNQDVTANVRFLGPDGAAASMPVVVPAGRPAYLDADQANLPFTEFSIIVESVVRLVAERRMTWDRTGQYGSHSGTGVAAPSTTWHFAEGATIAGLQTFFLLQNPGDVAATATLRFLLATGNVQERTHTVPAGSRLTVWANQEGSPLDAAEFSTTVVSDRPLVAERAMYRDAPGETFAAGSAAAGVTMPATAWFFAEGATGAFFDTYLLLSNPNDTPATVNVEFVRSHDFGDINTAWPIQKAYVLAPHSRRTIWVVQEDEGLRDTQVGARMASDLPIVAERTMWWPGPTSATWRENDAESGSPESGQLWAVTDVQADADDGGWDTFVLVATTEQYLSHVRIRVACVDGTTVTRDKSLSVNRTTLWMRYEFPEIVGSRCAATVESLPTRITLSPTVPLYRTPLVVEKAIYRGHFAAGGVTLATRLPDPP
ncbi:hypothetical protein LuPra_03572 [Luteitalea pratensis]|uniref:Uncharacterized protein n=2 Tax=Luteitalea pratensis TaxID=1855912 RepID=A0A143PNZ0_LUTPR|nr:hypothetical protein LuPra_03572 [Luteitalea pratensis]